MSDFIYKCTNTTCDFISVRARPACPICQSEITVALRPSIVEESIGLDIPDDDGDDFDAYIAAMKEEETAEAVLAERRYWAGVEADERDFDPLESLESLERFNSLRDMGFDPDSSGDFPY